MTLSTDKTRDYVKENEMAMPTTFNELDSVMRKQQVGEELENLLRGHIFLMQNILDDELSLNTFSSIESVTREMLGRLVDIKQLMARSEKAKVDAVEDEDETAQEDDEDEEGEESETKDNTIVATPYEETSGVYIYKDAIGAYRWIARYSNNIRDEDTPAEIISAKSHERFDKLVKAGVVDPPDLWIWHEKDWSIGKAEWVAVDKQDGHTFTVAGGYFHDEFQHLAKELSAHANDMRVSHGMPKWSIKRDNKDSTIIVEHITKEISLLPSWAAANPFTGFVTIKEHDNMAFSQEDKARLMETHGVTEALLNEVVALNVNDSKKAKSDDLETKDATVADATIAEVVEDIVDVEAKPAPVADSVQTLPIDVAETLEAIMKSVITVNERLEKGLNDLNDKVTGLEQGVEASVAEKAATSPLASLTSMMVGSIIGSEQARVDGRTSLAKDKPAETKSAGLEITGIPMVDGFINGSQ